MHITLGRSSFSDQTDNKQKFCFFLQTAETHDQTEPTKRRKILTQPNPTQPKQTYRLTQPVDNSALDSPVQFNLDTV